MFNQQFIDVLTQVNGITNSIILKHPRTVAVSESQDIMVHIDVAELDKDEFPDVGLMFLNEFLSLTKMFDDDRTVTIENNVINISSKDASSSYITGNLALMDIYNKDCSQFDKTDSVPSVCTFNLSTNDIKRIKGATGVFKDLTDVIFQSQDGDMKISLGALNSFNAKSNTYSVTKDAQSTKEFQVVIPVDNFNKIPQSDYTVEVKYNEARNAYRLLFVNKNIEGFKILMSVKV